MDKARGLFKGPNGQMMGGEYNSDKGFNRIPEYSQTQVSGFVDRMSDLIKQDYLAKQAIQANNIDLVNER